MFTVNLFLLRAMRLMGYHVVGVGEKDLGNGVKYFQDSGKVIVVVNQDDLEKVANGYSFLRLLRAKYETVRLDLIRGDTGDEQQ